VQDHPGGGSAAGRQARAQLIVLRSMTHRQGAALPADWTARDHPLTRARSPRLTCLLVLTLGLIHTALEMTAAQPPARRGGGVGLTFDRQTDAFMLAPR
jgi:hypothetical protein